MTAPVARAGMLIRRPAPEVFEAFVDPAITSRFWFTEGSGRLAPGARLRWEWAMYGVGTDVVVKAVEPARHLLVDWDVDTDPTQVEWTFEARGDQTWVTVENRGFGGALDEPWAKALESAGGFAVVLAGAKIWLEHKIEPGFVVDRHPDARVLGWGL